MSEQQKKNMVVFLLLNVVLGWAVYSYVLKKQITRREDLISRISQFGDKLQAGDNLKIRTGNIEGQVKDSDQFLTQIVKNFPSKPDQKGDVAQNLSALAEEIQGVRILKSPALQENAIQYKSEKTPPEDVENVYRGLLIDGMSLKPIEGRSKIPNALDIKVYSQDLEIEAEYVPFINFLVRLNGLPFYYELTHLELWQDLKNMDGKERVRAFLTISSVGLGSFPEQQ